MFGSCLVPFGQEERRVWIVKASFLAMVLVGFPEAHSHAQDTISVQIDIDTRSHENTIVIGERSIILVAIITSDDFNASKRVDYESVMLGGVLVENGWRGVGHPMCSESDVNRDGEFDLVCKFDAGKLKLQPGEQMIELTGKTIGDKVAIIGQDRVNAVQE